MRLYSERGYPYFIRMAPAVGPPLGVSLLVLAVSMLLTMPTQAVVGLAGITLMGVSLLLGFRCPPPLMPRWMRTEIDAGRLMLARPEPIDRVQFWILVFATAVVPVGGALLLLLENRV
jgi:hypothetical protein